MEVVNDGWNGLFAGATRGIGVNVTAGSSNNCRGRNKEGKEGRIVGNGPSFGEYGGGIEIVQRALHMVNYAWIKRIPPTGLTKILIEAVGARNELDLMDGLSAHRYHLSSHLALQIIRAAQEGDPAARAVIRWAGEELGWLAISVARQIGMDQDDVEIIQSGSVFEAGEIITSPMREVVLKDCPRAKLIRLDGPPVVGAVILGMEQAGFDGYSIRDAMVRTAKKIVNEA
jgi:N-acetylglucosamine kinase-like BadF-type ATPase